METALRKEKSNLTLSGVGVIAFGVWFFVKTILYNLFAKSYVTHFLGLDELSSSEGATVLFLWFLLCFLGMALHLYIGLCAVSKGTGKASRHCKAYQLAAWALLMGNLMILGFNLYQLFDVSYSVLEELCDMVMTLVRAANLAALLRAAGRIGHLEKESTQEASHAD